MFCDLGYELVTTNVDTPASSPFLIKADLAIPDGKRVVGSGALVTHIQQGPGLVAVDDLSDPEVVAGLEDLRISDGPNPADDDSKWRVMITQTSTRQLRVHAWIATIDA